jgi:hypothetical protein
VNLLAARGEELLTASTLVLLGFSLALLIYSAAWLITLSSLEELPSKVFAAAIRSPRVHI